MRSRWLADLLPPATGAVVEGVWTGVLAALVTGGSGAAYIGGASAATFGGALLAMRTGAGREPGRRARLAAAAYTLGVAAAFYAAGRGWRGSLPLVAVLGAVAFAALLVALGIALGRERISSDPAVRRAVRAFALLCGLLAIAAAAGSSPGWAAGAVVAALVAGALSVTAARAASLSGAGGDGDRTATWRWLLTAAAVLLVVVAAGALLSLVVRTDVLLWLLSVAGHVVQYILQLLAWLLGWVAAGILRALSWLLGLFHAHALPDVEPPKSAAPHIQGLPKAPTGGAYVWTRRILTAGAVIVAVAVPLFLVALALRRVRGSAPDEVTEEREAVLTLREASAGGAARLRRRLAQLVARRSPPATPAEQVRREYEALERRLARAGRPRPAASTVRDYLWSLAETGGGEGPAPRPDELVGLYERARYSRGGVDAAAALRFRELARGFPVPTPA